jgi:HAD superfamily hydrolase (TIGR01509 family)
MAAEPGSGGNHAGPPSIQEMLHKAECLLFDFDGPLCSLFAEHPAPEIAERFRTLLESRGLLKESLVDCPDPLRILHESHDVPGSTDMISPLQVQEEITAARRAAPTPGSLPLIAALAERHVPMAITTNNSAEAVRIYLDRHDLSDVLAHHVYGREEDPNLMKPDPFCINQAVTALGVPAERCLMIGDSPADVEAARKAGVRFLGFARNERKAEALRAEDEQVRLVDSIAYVHEQVLRHWPLR